MKTRELAERELIKFYRQMVQIREFEERAAEMYARGKIRGFLHLYVGEEAVGVGAIAALHADDYVISAYREHGHCLVKGADPKEVMAELFGKSTGISRGKGGSMHLFDYDLRFLGGYAIVGGGMPIAVGAALAVTYRGEDSVVACFFGDGAVNQGIFHESLNMAKLWNLPVLFICENNFYGIGTHVARVSAEPEIYKRACAYGMPGERVDGMDVLAVYDAVSKASERARDGQGPCLIEAVTYRYRGHSMADPGGYRTKLEEQVWRERDPIVNFSKRLVLEGIVEPEDLEEIKEEVVKEIDEAVRFADESPWPEVEELYSDVYVD